METVKNSVIRFRPMQTDLKKCKVVIKSKLILFEVRKVVEKKTKKRGKKEGEILTLVISNTFNLSSSLHPSALL